MNGLNQNLAGLAPWDGRFPHNPPRVEMPAMDQQQFDYDNQREIEAHLLANPVVMAHTVMMIRDDLKMLNERLKTLERIHG